MKTEPSSPLAGENALEPITPYIPRLEKSSDDLAKGFSYYGFQFQSSTNSLLLSMLSLEFVCSRHPEVLWAQRSDKVYLAVSVKCEPRCLFTFTASKPQHESYSFTLELYGSLNLRAVK
ncbi:hypothetical protein KIW84_012315 [Lathyrus oleraceus]|uniref:Uncharacterized protein n=1 Tax=Pisum sativum TaxID=3888 RepID=A0A9D5BH77_PEA|nr:hypothetical protein KIW84_012315 [Pisum sativum]